MTIRRLMSSARCLGCGSLPGETHKLRCREMNAHLQILTDPIDPAVGRDFSAVAAVRLNTDGTSTWLTEEEMAALVPPAAEGDGWPALPSEAEIRAEYQSETPQQKVRWSTADFTTWPGDAKEMQGASERSAKVQQRLSIVPSDYWHREPMDMHSQHLQQAEANAALPIEEWEAAQRRQVMGILSADRLGQSPGERAVRDELSLTKAALALRDRQIGTLCRQLDTAIGARDLSERELALALLEIAALKAAAASRETPSAPNKADVMGRAIGRTLAGWRPVI